MELNKVNKKVEDIKNNDNIFSVGKVIKVNPYTVIVSGLNDITYYEEVNIDDKAKGFVFAVGKNNVTISLIEVKEKITSPSFVILNEYHTGSIPIYHFDLYRLENEGIKTIYDELREYSEGKQVTFVEWAEFNQNEAPFNHVEINVTYNDDDSRTYEFKSVGEDEIVEDLRK